MAKNPNRFLVKVSGEALAGEGGSGIDSATLERIGADIAEAARERQIAVVVGGGNIFRGIQGLKRGIERTQATAWPPGDGDQRSGARRRRPLRRGQGRCTGGGPDAEPLPSLLPARRRPAALRGPCRGSRRRHRPALLHHRHRGRAARRRARLRSGAEGHERRRRLHADPRKDPAARRYDRLTHDEAIEKQLGVMDTAAFALPARTHCR